MCVYVFVCLCVCDKTHTLLTRTDINRKGKDGYQYLVAHGGSLTGFCRLVATKPSKATEAELTRYIIKLTPAGSPSGGVFY